MERFDVVIVYLSRPAVLSAEKSSGASDQSDGSLNSCPPSQREFAGNGNGNGTYGNGTYALPE